MNVNPAQGWRYAEAESWLAVQLTAKKLGVPATSRAGRRVSHPHVKKGQRAIGRERLSVNSAGRGRPGTARHPVAATHTICSLSSRMRVQASSQKYERGRWHILPAVDRPPDHAPGKRTAAHARAGTVRGRAGRKSDVRCSIIPPRKLQSRW